MSIHILLFSFGFVILFNYVAWTRHLIILFFINHVFWGHYTLVVLIRLCPKCYLTCCFYKFFFSIWKKTNTNYKRKSVWDSKLNLSKLKALKGENGWHEAPSTKIIKLHEFFYVLLVNTFFFRNNKIKCGCALAAFSGLPNWSIDQP